MAEGRVGDAACNESVCPAKTTLGKVPYLILRGEGTWLPLSDRRRSEACLAWTI